ncbi:beta strand repeat-containing protein [Reyranella soli]|nr:hypothetical protein [Reyranella soli]
MNGLTNATDSKTSKTAGAEANGYDVGFQIGSEGVGKDDIRELHFTLATSHGCGLTLDDFVNVDFGVRLTSVGQDLDGNGTIDTARSGGAKIAERAFNGAFDPVKAANDSAGSIDEDSTAAGNVLTNDTGCGGLKTLTSVTYQGTIYQFSAADPVVIALKDATGTPIGATLTIGSNGAYTVDALNADALGAGQKVAFDVLYEVRQTALESDGSVAGWATSSAHLTGKIVGLADGLSAVTDIDGTVNAVDENAGVGTAVGVTAHATGGSGSVSYAITGGSGMGLFAIGSNGVVTTAAAIDRETSGPAKTIEVTATSSGSSSVQTFTIAINDQNDNAPVWTTPATHTVAENTTLVSALSATDADATAANSTMAFSITGGADKALFDIVGGNLVFKAAPDYEAGKTSFAVEVTASDGAHPVVRAFTVNLVDQNDNAPVWTTPATQTVAENTTLVTALAAVDGDATAANNAVAFSITGGADKDLFDIVGGNLVFKSAPDYEAGQTNFAVEVTASDGAHPVARAFTVNLVDQNDNAPVWTTQATQAVAENTTLVTALAATDADATAANSTVAFSITGGADKDLFDIVGGNLVFKSAPDYEAGQTNFAVEVTATDGAHPVARAFTVNLVDQNDNAPVWTTLATQTVAENTTLVTALAATDADATAANSTVAFSITGGADKDLFDIVGGNLVFKSAADYEAGQTSFAVEVTASDGANPVAQAFTVNLVDQNDNAPVWTTQATQTVAENATLVTALSATDADATVANSTVAFSITGGADKDLFDIVGGNLVFKSAPDYEAGQTSFAVEVTASDGTHPVAQAFTVNLADQNDNAPAWTTPATQTVAENVTLVTALSAPDADANDTVTYSITGGADMALFDIVGGNLVFKSAPDYEAGQTSFAVEVTASDGAHPVAQAFTVNLVDQNDNAPVWLTSSTQAVAENTTLVTALSATDADSTAANNAVAFSITGGADKDLFDIVGGNLVFKSAPDYDAGQTSFAVEVTASDGANPIAQAFTVNLLDQNEAPVWTTPATQTVAENTTLVTALAAVDDDANDTVSYSITGGADRDLFDIVGGNLVFKSAPDYEAGQTSFAVEVTASDGTHPVAQAFTVNVSDVFEYPKLPDITWHPSLSWDPLPLTFNASVTAFGPPGGILEVATLTAFSPDHIGSEYLFAIAEGYEYFGATQEGSVAIGRIITPFNPGDPIRSSLPLVENTTYTLRFFAFNEVSGIDETFHVIAGSNSVNDTLVGYSKDDDMYAVTGRGSGDDVLYASGGDDTLFGLSGDDSLFGQSGTDTLNGGAGDDLLAGGAGGDTYNFAASGDGADTIVDTGNSTGDQIHLTGVGPQTYTALGFERVDDDLVITYGTGATPGTITVTDHYANSGRSVETITFDQGGTFLGYQLGTAAYVLSTDTSSPLLGDVPIVAQDMLASASTSGDTLQGASGNDLLFGNGGDDTLQGGPGNDLLVGGDGDDRLTGGANGDILCGGAGNDTFAFPALIQSLPGATGGNNNFDVIVDFVHGQDRIDFTNLAGIDASGGVISSFQGNITSGGNLTLNAHSVAYVETGGNTVVLVNTSANAETVTTSNFGSASMEIVLAGVNLGLTYTDFLHI